MQEKKALVLLNMGSSESKKELKLFLRNMFLDKNIIHIKNKFFRNLFSLFLSSVIINKSWKNYELIGGSPLKKITESLSKRLEEELDFSIFYAMRYTRPFAKEIIEKLKKEGIEEVILLPLYPQYSTTTVLSSLQDFYKYGLNDFKITEIKPFYTNRLYNELIVKKVIEKIGNNPGEFNLIFSAHSLPEKIVLNGDPYQKQLEEQIKIIKSILKEKDIEFKSISLAYQSKLGKAKWLEPSINDVLKKLANSQKQIVQEREILSKGAYKIVSDRDNNLSDEEIGSFSEFAGENIVIYPISFIIDNSETKFELDIFYKRKAEEYGVKRYEVVECFNDSDESIELIRKLIEN